MPQTSVTDGVQSVYLSSLKLSRNMFTGLPYTTLTCSPGFVQSHPLCSSCLCAPARAGTLALGAGWGPDWCMLCLSDSHTPGFPSHRNQSAKWGVNVFVYHCVYQRASSSCPLWSGMWPRYTHRPTNLKHS